MDSEYYTTIGMDVSDRTTKVCVMAKERGTRRILEETTIPMTRDEAQKGQTLPYMFYCICLPHIIFHRGEFAPRIAPARPLATLLRKAPRVARRAT